MTKKFFIVIFSLTAIFSLFYHSRTCNLFTLVFSYSVPLYFSLSSLLLLLPSPFLMPLHHPFTSLPFRLSSPPLSSFIFLSPPLTLKHTPTPGDWAGPEVWSQALVCDRQAPQGAYRQAVPWALAQPPKPRGKEDIVDWGGGPDHLPGTWETGKPLGWNR